MGTHELEAIRNKLSKVQKTIESTYVAYIRHYHKEIVEEATSFINPHYRDITFSQRLYHIRHCMAELGLCPVCRGIGKFGGSKRGYNISCSPECIKNRIQSSMVEKYGDLYSRTNEFKLRFESTSMDIYGVTNPTLSPDIKEKMMATNRDRYGGNSSFNSPKVRELFKENMMKKYGVDHPAKLMEVQIKCQKTGTNYRDYTMPSGKIVRVQGYEDHALNLLLKDYKEEDIICGKKQVGRVKYGNGRSYYPDFRIGSTFIEVKIYLHTIQTL